jgi:hypothetical protein
MSNFTLLNLSLPDVARLLIAMVQARDAVESRSWSHPQEPTTEEWWADVLADPRARIPKRRLVATAKHSSRVALSRAFLLRAGHGAGRPSLSKGPARLAAWGVLGGRAVPRCRASSMPACGFGNV